MKNIRIIAYVVEEKDAEDVLSKLSVKLDSKCQYYNLPIKESDWDSILHKKDEYGENSFLHTLMKQIKRNFV